MHIDGVLNFREVAGVAGFDGRLLKRGSLFRSGSFAAVTPAGVAQIKALQIRSICDLRNLKEQQRFAFSDLYAAGMASSGLRHDLELGELAAVLRAHATTPQEVAAAMQETYRKLPYYFTAIYREFFRLCLTQEGPVAVNCSVGKDRTGVGIALLLTALGVSQADVVAEYDKTNLQRENIRHHLRNRPGANRYAQISDEIIAPVLWANPSYLQGMFAALDERSGSSLAFLRDELGLGPEELAALQNRFLQAR